MSEVSETVLELSKKIEKHLAWDKEAHSINGDKDTFKTCIPDELNEKVIRAVNEFRRTSWLLVLTHLVIWLSVTLRRMVI